MKFQGIVQPHHTVVDFGCGGGEILASLERSRKIGVEVNPHARAIAPCNGIKCYATISEASTGIADVVISHHALEHVPYPIEAIQYMGPLLKETGVLVLCVPIDDWRKHKKYDPHDVGHHLHTWTVQLLENTLSEAGFAVGVDDIHIITKYAGRLPLCFVSGDAKLPLRDISHSVGY